MTRETDILLKNVDFKFDFQSKSYRWETILFVIILLAANITLLGGSPAAHLAYLPAAVESGEWWRIFTFPFVHVSGYNMLLDGAAFLLLYQGLEEESRGRRLLYVTGGIAGSLVVPLLFSPIIGSTGLAGLSGCAHGLMAITGIELFSRYPKRDILKKTGAILLAAVLIKSLAEAFTGQVLFAWLHFGDVGTPVADSHFGGVLGAITLFLLCNRKKGVRS